MNQDKYSSMKSRIVWMLIIVLVVGIVVGVTSSGLFASKLSFSSDGYQAVFLTNNQVYFGKIAKADSTYPVLTDVYYIQALAPQDLSSAAAAGSQLHLVKLGSELHQPQDTIYLNRSQILFIEPLKADSKIVQAIGSFKQTLGQ